MSVHQQHTTEQRERVVHLGEVYGFGGERATVVQLHPAKPLCKVRFVSPHNQRTQVTGWIGFDQLQPAPALPEHIEQAAGELAPMLSNPHKAVFGREAE